MVCLFSLFIFGNVNATLNYNNQILTISEPLVQNEIDSINNGYYSNAVGLVITSKSILDKMKFDKLSNIESLILPSDVTEIPNQEFKNCKKLVNVNWEDLVNLKTIGEEAFMCTAIGPTFYVPNSVEEIKKGAFEDCDSIKTLIFDEGSQIQHIYSRAFYQDENTIEGKLSDVYINVKPARAIVCDNGAFDKTHTCGQTQVGTVTTRLHYPSELFEYYVGTYKSTLYDQNYDIKGSNGAFLEPRQHSYGIVTQTIINQAFEKANNGWQEFFSSGIPVGKESLYRTYSDNVAYKVPYTSEFQIYIVVDYDINSNLATCIQMNYHDIIPANTGIIVHSNVEGTVFLEYVKDDDHLAYDNEKYPNNLYQYSDEKSYTNYLKPINGELHIDNVEIVNGVKTYRNYFFNKGTTAALRPGPDWKEEYTTLGWGFFRAVSNNYRVFNKAFLHLPASMTEASSERINDSGNLPQDNAQPQNNSKESFTMFISNWEDMVIKPINFGIATTIKDSSLKLDDSYYTLEGLRIKNPSKGIYIKNERKVIIK